MYHSPSPRAQLVSGALAKRTSIHDVLLCCVIMAVGLLTACIRTRSENMIIAVTPLNEIADSQSVAAPTATSADSLILPTANPTRPVQVQPRTYTVQAGDTLSGIAAQFGVSLQSLVALNELLDPNLLEVGQVILLPEPPDEQTSNFKIIPDSRLVRGPGSQGFDVAAFIDQQSGYVRVATDEVAGAVMTATQIVQRVSLEFSVEARLLLALLEYRAGWLTNGEPPEELRARPLGAGPSPLGFDREGLYRQLTWAADQLNAGYYGWKYRGLQIIDFDDGPRLRFGSDLNAGTIAVQYMLGQFNAYSAWQNDVDREGLYRTYVELFGDPFINPIEPLVPSDVQQPPLMLPFESGEIWYFTGGPHGGWGSGSAWSAIDFGPPDDVTTVDSACYVSGYWVTAVAAGVIARTDEGVVVLDLDGDGDESTGWSILYLHLAGEGRVGENINVNAGDRLGRPSCEGGFSNGTHVHIARRYNGEWIPADCRDCLPSQTKPSFVMGDWVVFGLPGQEYQGFMANGAARIIAEQGRLTTENLISW